MPTVPLRRFSFWSKMPVGIFRFICSLEDLCSPLPLSFFSPTLLPYESIICSCFAHLFVHEMEIFLYTSVSWDQTQSIYMLLDLDINLCIFKEVQVPHSVPFAEFYWEIFYKSTFLLWRKKLGKDGRKAEYLS